MSNFHQSIVQLIEQIYQAEDHALRIELPLDDAPKWSLIDWLDVQPVFPKFYWQDRDASEEVVSLGAVHTFTDPAPAYAVLGEHQRVWGGRSFDGGTQKNASGLPSFFFLPQVELIRRQNQWFLAVNLNADRLSVIETLHRLETQQVQMAEIDAQITGVRHAPTQDHWSELIDDVLSSVEQQHVKKVVLARETCLALSKPLSAAQLLKASYANNHNSFHFMLVLNEQESFMGSTPERLYCRYGHELQTEALAGTIGRGQTNAEDEALAYWLLHDEKNINENQYVVDDIVDRITPHASEVTVEPEVKLVQLRKVQHLRRRIQVALKSGINGVQLLSALQPTAAVSGVPRKEAFQFILDKEPFIRGWYAGSMGYFSHEQAEFCVAIRSALVLDKEVRLYAGAGIVPGSIAEYEWQELDKKMSTLKSLIDESHSLEVVQ